MRSAISTARAGRRRNGRRNSAPSTTWRTRSGPTTASATTSSSRFRPARSTASARRISPKSPGLFTALRNAGFRYDTSGVGQANAWPQKIDGLWRFDLVQPAHQRHRQGHALDGLQFPGRAVRRLPEPGAARRAQFREQMVQTYLDYFRANYTGNRAPLHIGHHFSDYQHGAYREALKTFARIVCGLPEVRCTTYSQARRLHGCAAPRDAGGLSQGRLPARRRSRPSICACPRRHAPRADASRYAAAARPASQPSIAHLRVMPQ